MDHNRSGADRSRTGWKAHAALPSRAMDAAEGPAELAVVQPFFRDTQAPQLMPVRRRRSSPRRAQVCTANGLRAGGVVGENNNMDSAVSTAGAISSAVPASVNAEFAQAYATRRTEVLRLTSSNARSQPPRLRVQEPSAGASRFSADADSAAIDATTFCSSHKVSCGAGRSRSTPRMVIVAGMQGTPTANIGVPEQSSPAFMPTARPSHFLSSAPGATSTSPGVNATLGVAQTTRRFEQDSGFGSRAGRGAQQSQEFLPETNFTRPSSGWTDSTDRAGTPPTTASRSVLQTERGGATASVPGVAALRWPSTPASAEIQSNLTYFGEATTPRAADVVAATAAATGAVNSSASLTSASASATGVTPTAAAPAVSDGQVRFEHVTYCSVCGLCPGAPPDGMPEYTEVVFCGTCPRKFCLGCFPKTEPLDTLAPGKSEDESSCFRLIPDGCSYCRAGTDREVPVYAGEPHPLPHACVASAEITRVMKAMLQWLGSHDLARFFVEDVDLRRFTGYRRRVRTPMSLAKIRRKIDSQAYCGEPTETGMALPTEAGMTLFLRDLALIERNCKQFNTKPAGISRSAVLLVERAHLYYRSHIEPLAAELGFPHMLSKTYACNGRVRIGGKGNSANRGSGKQGADIDGAVGGTGDRASTSRRRSSAAPPISSSPDLAGPRDHAPTNSPSQAQSTSIMSPSDSASSRGTSAGSSRPIDGATDPDMDAVRQARKAHHELCYVCLRAPEIGHQGRSGGEEVVFCRECPRMVCVPCHTTKQPTADRGERERGRDRHGVFWITPRCGHCLSKAGSETSSPPTRQPAVAASTSVEISVERESGSLAAAVGVGRLFTANMSTAGFTTGSANLNSHFEAHFEADRGQSGIGVRDRFPVGQVVWVYTSFAADGFEAESMHVPGFVQARKEAVGTSPAMFTVNCFGKEDAVVQATEDRLFLFPMEADLDSAKCAVTHGLYLEEGCGPNYLNVAVAQAMEECIRASWNPATGTNIYHAKTTLDTIETDKKLKDYAEVWGMDSAKLAQLLREASFAGLQGGTRTANGHCRGCGSRVRGAGGANGMAAAAVTSVRGAREDGDNSVGGVKGGVGADAAGGDEAPPQAGSHCPSTQSSGSLDTRTARPPALQVSPEAMLVGPDAIWNYGSALPSAAGEMIESLTQPPTPDGTGTDGTASSTPICEHSTWPPCSKVFDTPPAFDERDFPQGRH